jgi:hypothetical protein
MRKLTPLLSGLLALTLCLAAQAAAAGPNAQTVPFIDVENFVNTTTCGFPITVQGHGDLTVQTLPDGRTLVVFPGTAYTTISANGNTLTTRNSGITFIESTGASSGAGISAVVTVPGGGVVLLVAGRFVTDADGNVVFSAGPNTEASGDVAAFCAALA